MFLARLKHQTLTAGCLTEDDIPANRDHPEERRNQISIEPTNWHRYWIYVSISHYTVD